MVKLTDSQIYQEIGNIVSQFQLYQCYECARAVMRWLTDNEIMMRTISSAIAWGMTNQLRLMENTTG